MSDSKEYSIEIAGKLLSIHCSEGEVHVRDVEALIRDSFENLQEAEKDLFSEKATKVILQLADSLVSLKKELIKLDQKITPESY